MSAHHSSCFPDTVFEEMALDRLDDDLRQQVEEHLPTCKECTARHDAILSETRSLQEELRAIETVPDTPCIEQLSLALFIDGSLPNAERDSVETHLSTCRSCQERLVELHRTVAELTDESANSPSASQFVIPSIEAISIDLHL